MTDGALPQRKREALGLLLLAGALAVGAAVGVSWAAGWQAVIHRIADCRPGWFAIAIGSEAVAYLGYALAYREVARVEHGPELPRRGVVAIVAAGFGPFVARGGFHFDLQALRGAGVSDRDARIRVLGLGALEYIPLAAAACISAIVVLLARKHLPGGLTWPWAIGVPAGVAAAGLALPLRGRIGRRGRVRGAIRHGLDAIWVVRSLLVRPRDHGAAALLGTALYWFGDMVALWACLRGFLAHEPSVPRLILGYATGYALTRRTLPLGGAGAVETLLPLALAWVGLPLAGAAPAVFVYRFFNLWLPLVPAAIAIPHVRRLPAKLEG